LNRVEEQFVLHESNLNVKSELLCPLGKGPIASIEETPNSITLRVGQHTGQEVTTLLGFVFL
jgi:hypothetical protein